MRAINVSAVKSLHLTPVAEATIGRDGIAHDREYMFADATGRIATQRSTRLLAGISSTYDAGAGELELVLPGGERVRATPRPVGTTTVELWGREFPATVMNGPFADAVSEVVGTPLRLLRAQDGIRALDSHAVSLLSQASVEEVGRRGGRAGLDPRRFRPTLLIDGCDAHAEDAWVGGVVRAGEARLRVVRLDPRCALTTLDPDTGERDADTLRWLAGYRRHEDGEVYCGIYADVEEPGHVCVGDEVEPLEDA
ncbi:MAG TPA: MOSC domain-containing protein [Gaiellales bacterium]